jgi:Gpi18-like mannosyltransferase
MNINLKKINLKSILIAAFLIRLILLPFGNHSDINNHVIWGKYGQEFGFMGYYDWLNFFGYNHPNQPPITILTYTAIKYVHNFIYQPIWYLNIHISAFPSNVVTWYVDHGFQLLLKLPSVLADIGIGYFIFKICQKFTKNQNKSLLAASLYLFNPITIYNSALWGQTDAYVNIFFLASLFLLLFKPKTPLVLPLFVLSLLTKTSLIIFTPLIIIYYLKTKPTVKNIASSILISLGLIYLITLPFAPSFFLNWVYLLYTKNIFLGEMPHLTANAFNLWALIYGFKPIVDSIKLINNISAYEIGLILFSAYLIFVLVALWRNFNFLRFLFALTLVGFGAFIILTRMHERYLFPIFIPMTILCVQKIIPLKIYFITSFIHLINLYHYWWFPKISPLIFLFSQSIIEKAMIVILIIIFVKFNLAYFKTNDH